MNAHPRGNKATKDVPAGIAASAVAKLPLCCQWTITKTFLISSLPQVVFARPLEFGTEVEALAGICFVGGGSRSGDHRV